jgi:hypothetical protein
MVLAQLAAQQLSARSQALRFGELVEHFLVGFDQFAFGCAGINEFVVLCIRHKDIPPLMFAASAAISVYHIKRRDEQSRRVKEAGRGNQSEVM